MLWMTSRYKNKMEPQNMKKEWRRFNKVVNDLARCVVCSKSFEHEVYMCTNSHNVCHSCYHPTMEGVECGHDGCTGKWLHGSCNNIVLTKLSQLRFNLYAARDMVHTLHEKPWEELLQCVVCYETCSEIVFSCNSGHIWCRQCQESLEHFKTPEKCHYCNQPHNGRPRRNTVIENIVKGLRLSKRERKVNEGDGGLIRRRGRFACPISGCNTYHFLQQIYVHLRTEHPDGYLAKEKFDYVEKTTYELTTFTLRDYSAACHIIKVGLFGVKVTFISSGRNGIFLDRAYLVYLSGFHNRYRYTLQVRYLTKRDRTVVRYINGVASSEHTEETALAEYDANNIADRTAGIPFKPATPVTLRLELSPLN